MVSEEQRARYRRRKFMAKRELWQAAVVFIGTMGCPLEAVAQPVRTAPHGAATHEDPASASGKLDPPILKLGKSEAVARFQSGISLFDDKDFAAALVEFRRAYAVAPNFRVLYNMAQCCYEMQDYVCALTSFERYLAEGGTRLPHARRTEVARDIKNLESRVGKLEIVANLAGAEVSIDDVAVGTTPLAAAVALSVGRRKVIVTKAGYVSMSRVVELGGLETQRLVVDLAEVPLAPQATPPPSQLALLAPPLTPRQGPRWTTLSWVGLGSAAALGIGATILGGVALSSSSDLKTTTYTGENEPPAFQSEKRKAKTMALASDVTAGAAAVTLVTTLVLTYFWPAKRTATAASPPLRMRVSTSALGVDMEAAF